MSAPETASSRSHAAAASTAVSRTDGRGSRISSRSRGRQSAGAATRLHMFAKSVISTIDLADLTRVLPLANFDAVESETYLATRGVPEADVGLDQRHRRRGGPVALGCRCDPGESVPRVYRARPR